MQYKFANEHRLNTLLLLAIIDICCRDSWILKHITAFKAGTQSFTLSEQVRSREIISGSWEVPSLISVSTMWCTSK